MSKKPIMTLTATVARLGMGGCLGMATLAPLVAEDLKVADFDYIRLEASVGVVAAPDVTEDTKDSAGTNTSYDWNGTRDNGIRGAITAIFGRGTATGGEGWQWGVELAYARYDITPADFTVAGSVVDNGSGTQLEYRTIGVNVLGGWQWGMTDIEEFTGFVEIMPHLGGGMAFADNEINTSPVGTPASYEQESGTGFYWEAGLRVGAYITERRMIYGVNVSYTYSAAKVDMDFPGGYSSDLDFKGHGFGIGAVAGYRF
jgi:hypothetical protein